MANIKKTLKSAEKLDIDQRKKQILELIYNADINQIKTILPFVRENDKELIEGVIKQLEGYLDDQKDGVRKSAVKMISEYKTKGAKEMLIKVLDDSRYDIRKIATKALVAYEDKDMFDVFIKILGDDFYETQAIAAKALGNLGNPDAVIPLAKLVGDKYKVGAEAAQALGKLKDKRALQPLYEALEEFNPNNEYIIVAMGEIGAEDYIDKLESISIKTMGEKMAVQVALAMTKKPEVIPYLVSCFKNIASASYYEFTIRCLGITQCIEAAIPIIHADSMAYKHSWHGDEILSVRSTAIQALISLPQLETLEIIIKAIEANYDYDLYHGFIENVNDPSAKDLLYSLSQHKKKKIRDAALKAIVRINS